MHGEMVRYFHTVAPFLSLLMAAGAAGGGGGPGGSAQESVVGVPWLGEVADGVLNALMSLVVSKAPSRPRATAGGVMLFCKNETSYKDLTPLPQGRMRARIDAALAVAALAKPLQDEYVDCVVRGDFARAADLEAQEPEGKAPKGAYILSAAATRGAVQVAHASITLVARDIPDADAGSLLAFLEDYAPVLGAALSVAFPGAPAATTPFAVLRLPPYAGKDTFVSRMEMRKRTEAPATAECFRMALFEVTGVGEVAVPSLKEAHRDASRLWAALEAYEQHATGRGTLARILVHCADRVHEDVFDLSILAAEQVSRGLYEAALPRIVAFLRGAGFVRRAGPHQKYAVPSPHPMILIICAWSDVALTGGQTIIEAYARRRGLKAEKKATM
jgi:hypothetical protein